MPITQKRKNHPCMSIKVYVARTHLLIINNRESARTAHFPFNKRKSIFTCFWCVYITFCFLKIIIVIVSAVLVSPSCFRNFQQFQTTLWNVPTIATVFSTIRIFGIIISVSVGIFNGKCMPKILDVSRLANNIGIYFCSWKLFLYTAYHVG